MAMNDGMFSSNHSDWETPQELFDLLDEEFGFDLDVCATHENHKCKSYITPYMDGLETPWHGVCFMNPPYGRQIGKWIKRAYEYDGIVVCLIPARTDTRWWHSFCIGASEIRFIKGRLRFGRGGVKADSAPFPSCVVVFRGGDNGEYPSISSWEI